jgi:hypothetical protein
MLSILNRSLITLLFLFGTISLANAQTGATPQSAVNPGGWTFIQDSIATFCTSGSSCNITTGNMLPTTAGSVWIVRIKTGNNLTISSVTGGGGTWTICPNCHIFNGTNQNLDAAYNLSGTGGTTSVTVNLSQASSGSFQVHFIELLPPPGSTASFDAAGTVNSPSCTTCRAVGLTLSGTDAVFQTYGGNGTQGWNSWSSPYITDGAGYGVGLNVNSGTAPTVAMTSPNGAIFMALAFKSSLGTFTPPAAQFSLVNYTSPVGGINCNPTCSLTIPSTGSGHLLYIEAGDIVNSHIVSINGGGTWVIPSGGNSCQISFSLAGNNALSCGYVLSSTPGTTSLGVTMSGGGATAFAVSEIASASGSFSFDTQGSTTNSASFNPKGQALTLTGTNDVIFQSIFVPGGTSSENFYPLPYIDGQGHQFFNNEAAQATLLNTASGAAPLWVDQQNQTTVVSGVAFKAVGGSAPPNPPTGLTAVVQ